MSRPSSSNPPASGALLGGRYRLEGELGRGAMGAVFRARDQVGGREVAVKLLLGRLSAERLERFRREGIAAANLTHPGILRVHAAGEEGGRPFLVCELVPGCRGLGEVAPGLGLRRRAELVRDAARALGFAHERGVLHRDVKPDNLLVSEDGRLLVADFGLAAIQGEDRLTKTGALLGTPHYLAPETFGGRWGPPADVWSLGVVLYEALTGSLPFDAESLTELAGQIAHARPTPIRELRPEVSSDLARVCERALSPDPQRRYPNASALADDLDLVFSGSRPAGSALRSPWRRPSRPQLLALLAVLTACGALWAATSIDLSAPPAPPRARRTPAAPPEAEAAAREAERERAELARLEPVERYWAGVAWLERHPGAAGAVDVRRWLEAAAAAPLVTLAPSGVWAHAATLDDGGVVTTSGRQPCEVERWEPSGPGRYRRAQGWAFESRVWVSPWSGQAALLLVDPARGVGRIEQPAGAPAYELAPVLSTGRVQACFPAGSSEDPSFVVCTQELILSWPAARPTHPIEPETEGHLIGPAAGRVGVDRLAVGFSAGEVGLLRVWELSTETILVDYPLPKGPRSLDVGPAGRFVALGGDTGVILVYDIEQGAGVEPKTYADTSSRRGGVGHLGHDGSVDLLRFTPDGEHLVTISHDSTNGDELKLWDVSAATLLGYRQLTEQVTSADFDRRPGYLWLGTASGEVQLWALPGPAGPPWGGE